MFSVLVFMCRDPGDTTSKVLCCVEPSYYFKNRDFDAIVKVPPALPLKMSLSQKRKYSKSLKCLFRRHYAFVRRFDLSTFTNKASVAFWQEFDFNFTYQLYVFFFSPSVFRVSDFLPWPTFVSIHPLGVSSVFPRAAVTRAASSGPLQDVDMDMMTTWLCPLCNCVISLYSCCKSHLR